MSALQSQGGHFGLGRTPAILRIISVNGNGFQRSLRVMVPLLVWWLLAHRRVLWYRVSSAQLTEWRIHGWSRSGVRDRCPSCIVNILTGFDSTISIISYIIGIHIVRIYIMFRRPVSRTIQGAGYIPKFPSRKGASCHM